MTRALGEGLALVRRRPALTVAWALMLLVPAWLATMPLDAVLRGPLDLTPIADRLVTPPADDALWAMLGRCQPGTFALVEIGVVLAVLLALPLACLMSGVVARSQLGVERDTGWVAARSLGAALVGLPLRALVWVAAALIALQATATSTFGALARPMAIALGLYALGSSLCAVLTDYARAFVISDEGLSLHRAWARAFAVAARHGGLTLGLVLLELALGGLAFAPLLATRPLGLYALGTGALAAVALFLRAAGTVAGVAAATSAASRSA